MVPLGSYFRSRFLKSKSGPSKNDFLPFHLKIHELRSNLSLKYPKYNGGTGITQLLKTLAFIMHENGTPEVHRKSEKHSSTCCQFFDYGSALLLDNNFLQVQAVPSEILISAFRILFHFPPKESCACGYYSKYASCPLKFKYLKAYFLLVPWLSPLVQCDSVSSDTIPLNTLQGSVKFHWQLCHW